MKHNLFICLLDAMPFSVFGYTSESMWKMQENVTNWMYFLDLISQRATKFPIWEKLKPIIFV